MKTLTNHNGVPYFSKTINGETVYSFTKDFEDIWDQETEDTYSVKAAASALGRKGGSAKSDAKAKKARENGKKGGRPVKQSARIFKNRDGYWTVMLESGEIADGLLQGDEWMRLDLAMARIRRRTDYRPIRDASLDRSI